jgi:hypothetical protein
VSAVELLSLFNGTSSCGCAEGRADLEEEESKGAEEERDPEIEEDLAFGSTVEAFSRADSLMRSLVVVCLGARVDPGGRPLPLRLGTSPPSEDEGVLRDF